MSSAVYFPKTSYIITHSISFPLSTLVQVAASVDYDNQPFIGPITISVFSSLSFSTKVRTVDCLEAYIYFSFNFRLAFSD